MTFPGKFALTISLLRIIAALPSPGSYLDTSAYVESGFNDIGEVHSSVSACKSLFPEWRKQFESSVPVLSIAFFKGNDIAFGVDYRNRVGQMLFGCVDTRPSAIIAQNSESEHRGLFIGTCPAGEIVVSVPQRADYKDYQPGGAVQRFLAKCDRPNRAPITFKVAAATHQCLDVSLRDPKYPVMTIYTTKSDDFDGFLYNNKIVIDGYGHFQPSISHKLTDSNSHKICVDNQTNPPADVTIEQDITVTILFTDTF